MERILIFSSGYYPGQKYGGPVTSLENMVDQLGKKYKIFVVAKNHDHNEVEKYSGINKGWNQIGNASVIYLSERESNFRNIKLIIQKINPKLIYQSSFFDYTFALKVFSYLLYKRNVQLIIAPRGELLSYSLSVKRIKKIIYIYLFNLLFKYKCFFHATSIQEKTSIINTIKHTNSKILFLENLPTIPKQDYSIFQKEDGYLAIIYFARIHPIKNLHFALECLNNVKGSVLFDIYGNIENNEYWDKCKKIILSLPSNINVNYKGLADHKNIYKIIGSYHALFLPTKSENYGHTIIEAMLASKPVIISDQTPWSDININNSGWALPLIEKSKFTSTIQELVDMHFEDYSELVKRVTTYIKNRLQLEDQNTRYFKMFEKIFNLYQKKNKAC